MMGTNGQEKTMGRQHISRRGLIKIGTAGLLFPNVGIIRASSQINATSTVDNTSVYSGSYDNVNNWPSATNRPQLSEQILSWIGPPGGGASTSNDQAQSVTLINTSGRTINTPGVTIQGEKIGGTLTILANNVTVKRCAITGGITIGQPGTSNHPAGVVIEECNVRGGTNSIWGAGVFRRNDIAQSENPICVWYTVGSSLDDGTQIWDNYIHDLTGAAGAHFDGIQADGGFDNMNIQHNWIDNQNGQTSCIMIDNSYGSINNVLVRNNKLTGSVDFNIYVDGNLGSGGMTNIRIIGNQLNNTNSYTGHANFLIRRGSASSYDVIHSGNVNHITGAHLD